MIQMTVRNLTGADTALLDALAKELGGYWTATVSNDETALLVKVTNNLRYPEEIIFEWGDLGEDDDDVEMGWMVQDTTLDIPELHEEFDLTKSYPALATLLEKVIDWYAHSDKEL